MTYRCTASHGPSSEGHSGGSSRSSFTSQFSARDWDEDGSSSVDASVTVSASWRNCAARSSGVSPHSPTGDPVGSEEGLGVGSSVTGLGVGLGVGSSVVGEGVIGPGDGSGVGASVVGTGVAGSGVCFAGGATGDGVTGDGVTGDGVTGAGVSLGSVGMGVTCPGSVGMGVTGEDVTGDGVTTTGASIGRIVGLGVVGRFVSGSEPISCVMRVQKSMSSVRSSPPPTLPLAFDRRSFLSIRKALSPPPDDDATGEQRVPPTIRARFSAAILILGGWNVNVSFVS
mmetsp:Transcript_25570/g.54329  ORF Transcript_25570/g.54329 Transcript_25570/m.54329 type:complete len:284 (-) Transcript_25570:164-1015(-)